MLRKLFIISPLIYIILLVGCQIEQPIPSKGYYNFIPQVLNSHYINSLDLKNNCDIPYTIQSNPSLQFMVDKIDSCFLEYSKNSYLNFRKVPSNHGRTLFINLERYTDNFSNTLLSGSDNKEIIKLDSPDTNNNPLVSISYFNGYAFVYVYISNNIDKKEYEGLYQAIFMKTINKILNIPPSNNLNSIFSTSINLNKPQTKISEQDIVELNKYYPKTCPVSAIKPTFLTVYDQENTALNSIPITIKNISSNNSPITELGVCLSVSNNLPDTNDINIKASYSFAITSRQMFDYNVYCGNLQANQVYNIRTYAKNNLGIQYSAPFQLKTKNAEVNSNEHFQLINRIVSNDIANFASFNIKNKVYFTYLRPSISKIIASSYNVETRETQTFTNFPINYNDFSYPIIRAINTKNKGYFFFFRTPTTGIGFKEVRVAEIEGESNDFKSMTLTLPTNSTDNIDVYTYNDRIFFLIPTLNNKTEIWEYFPSNNTIQLIRDFSNMIGRGGYKAFYLNEKIFFISDGYEATRKNFFEYYDLAQQKFIQLPVFLGNYSSSPYSYFMYEDNLNIISNTNYNPYKKTEHWQFDTVKNNWIYKKNPPFDIYFSTLGKLFSYDNKNYFVVNNITSKSIEVYNFIP